MAKKYWKDGEVFEGHFTITNIIDNVESTVAIYSDLDSDWERNGFIRLDKYIKFEIDKNKKLLADSDYKVIKCYEASVKGEELPYDLSAVIAERDGYRAEINSLEEGLREYLATV